MDVYRSDWLRQYAERVGIAGGALSLSAEIIEPKASEYLDRLQQIVEIAKAWASDRDLLLLQFTSQANSASSKLTRQAIV